MSYGSTLRFNSSLENQSLSEVTQKDKFCKRRSSIDKKSEAKRVQRSKIYEAKKKQLNAQESKKRKEEDPSYAPGGFVDDVKVKIIKL